MQGKGLFSAASWSLTGQVGYYGFQWMNMIILARISGPEAVGLYTLGLAIANPIMAIASLMLRMVYVTDQENRWSFSEYNKVRWLALPVGVVFVGLAGFVLGYRDLTLVIILIAASWKVAETLSDINYAIPNKAGDMRAIALSMIGRAALSSFVLALTLNAWDRLDYALAAFSLTWWVCYSFHDKKFEAKAEEKQGDGTPWSLTRFAFPMALSAAVIYFTFSIPRIVLDRFEDTATLGIFAAVSHLLLIGALAVNSLGAAVTPRLSRYFNEGRMGQYYREIAISCGAALFVSMGFILVAYVAGEFIISLIYGRSLGAQGDLVLAMAIASVPIYLGSIIGFVPPALQAYRFHLTINVITLVGTLGAALYFVPTHGVMGAVYAIIVQGVFQLLNALILLRKPRIRPSRTAQNALPEAG